MNKSALIKELCCPQCGTGALHLIDMRCADATHRNKVNLHFRCDACGKISVFRVWGHEGEKSEQLYGVTGTES